MISQVIVTGGSGLLGAALVKQLLHRGELRPVVVDMVSTPDRLADVKEQVEYIQADVADPVAFDSIVGKIRPRCIYHFAALLGGPCEDDPVEAMRVNVNAVVHLLEAARQHGVAQVLFASSLTTFGLDLNERVQRDNSLQRPISFYGVSKLFGEGAGRFYRRKFGIDFRAIRYPAIVGPGYRAGGLVNYTSEMIEECAQGNPYTIRVKPDTRIPIIYTSDAARAMILLASAPAQEIKTINYLLDGVQPTPSAGEMAAAVERKISGAEIDFQPIQEWQSLLDVNALPIDDTPARMEWGWQAEYDSYEKIIDIFLG